MTSLFNIRENISFNRWLTSTYVDELNIGYIINIFIKEGLSPLINKYGYRFGISLETQKNLIATVMYKFSLNKFYIIKLPKNVEFEGEHYELFEDTLPWNSFWNTWNLTFDNIFDSMQIHIQQLVWVYIDLESSPTYINYITQLLDEEDEDNNNLDFYNYHTKFKKFDIT